MRRTEPHSRSSSIRLMVAPSNRRRCVALGRSALGACCAALFVVAPLAAQEPAPSVDHAVVRAVLFYSPTCPHCRDLATVDLPPILARYGDRLRIAAISVASRQGQAIYQAMVQRFDVPNERLGVPTLVVGSRVLVGGVEIPAELPGIVERGLAHGGISWPAEPLLRQALAAQGVEGAAPVGAAPGPPAEAAAAPPPQAPKPLPRPEGTASPRARASGALGVPPAEVPAAQGAAVVRPGAQTHRSAADAPVRPREEIGRASCRGRV